MKRVLLPLAAALLVLTLGCDRRHGGDGFDFFIGGSWSGRIHDSICGEGTITFFFEQSGGHFSGHWRIRFEGSTDPRCRDSSATDGELTGPLSGSVNGGALELTLQRTQGSTGCAFTQPIALRGTWTDSRLGASYSGTSCSGPVSGTVDASR